MLERVYYPCSTDPELGPQPRRPRARSQNHTHAHMQTHTHIHTYTLYLFTFYIWYIFISQAGFSRMEADMEFALQDVY